MDDGNTSSCGLAAPQRITHIVASTLRTDFRHVARIATLPFHHRDPFDRLLAAQAALEEDCPIVSANQVFRKYGVKRIW